MTRRGECCASPGAVRLELVCQGCGEQLEPDPVAAAVAMIEEVIGELRAEEQHPMIPMLYRAIDVLEVGR